jgi:rRNA maturation endonuclease Nob1
MGVIDRVRNLLSMPSAEQAEPFVCIKCGETYPKPKQSCGNCGAPFVVEADEE